METFELYVIMNRDGKYLRSGRWVKEIKNAKIYTKMGHALAQITTWTKSYPELGTPQLVPLTVTPCEPVNQVERVNLSIKKSELIKAKMNLLRAEKSYEKAKYNLEASTREQFQREFEVAEIILRNRKNELDKLNN
jgi:hypothetical protein